MAKISVNERDLSWYYRNRQRSELTVYVPGLAAFGPYDPMYVNEGTINAFFGRPIGVKNDYSYYIAKSFAKAGVDVLFHRIPLPGAAQAVAYPVPEKEGGSTMSMGSVIYTITCTNAKPYEVTIFNNTPGNLEIRKDGTVIATYPAGQEVMNQFAAEDRELVDEQLANIEDDPSYTITKVSKDIISVGDEEIILPLDEPYEVKVDLADAEALETQLNSKGLPFTKEERSITIKAKYPGDFGNQLITKVSTAGPGTRYFTTSVQSLDGKSRYIVEYLTVNFSDPLNQYYYENVENSTNYLDFEVTGDIALDDVSILEKGYLKFQDGKDYDIEKFSDENTSKDVVTEAVIVMSSLKEKSDADYDEKDPYNAYSTFFDILKNPYGYYFDILTNGGLSINSKDAYAEAVELPTGVVDVPEGRNFTIDKLLTSVALVSGVSVYLIGGGRKDIMDAAEFKAYCGREAFDTSFVSGVGPWGFSQLLSEGSRVWLPGWYAQITQWADSVLKGNPIWYAPAGTQRAQVGSIIAKTDYEVGDAILDMWQNQDYTVSNIGAYKLNPIMSLKQYGYCIYGNSTLLKSKYDGSTSMLQSLGTRVLVNRIKAKAFDVALGMQFDQLTDNLFYRFKELMTPFMELLRHQEGLYDWDILYDWDSVTYEDLNQRTVPVLIRISPNPAAENFDITCEVYPAGITFTDEFDETSIIA